MKFFCEVLGVSNDIKSSVASTCSENDSSVWCADGNAATVGCTLVSVVGVADLAGGLLLGLSVGGGASSSVLSPFDWLSDLDGSTDVVMSGLCCGGSRGVGSGVAWAAFGGTLFSDSGVGHGGQYFTLVDWCTLAPSVVGSTSESWEAGSGGTGGNWACACSLFSKGVFLNLAESVLDAGVGEGAGWESEENEGLFHFE